MVGAAAVGRSHRGGVAGVYPGSTGAVQGGEPLLTQPWLPCANMHTHALSPPGNSYLKLIALL